MSYVNDELINDLTLNAFGGEQLTEGVLSFGLFLKSVRAQWTRDVHKDWSKCKDVWIEAVKNCKTMKDIETLRKDFKSVKSLEKRLENTKKDSKEFETLKEHIQWINSLGKQMLDKKATDLKTISKEEREKGTWEGKKKKK